MTHSVCPVRLLIIDPLPFAVIMLVLPLCWRHFEWVLPLLSCQSVLPDHSWRTFTLVRFPNELVNVACEKTSTQNISMTFSSSIQWAALRSYLFRPSIRTLATTPPSIAASISGDAHASCHWGITLSFTSRISLLLWSNNRCLHAIETRLVPHAASLDLIVERGRAVWQVP